VDAPTLDEAIRQSKDRVRDFVQDDGEWLSWKLFIYIKNILGKNPDRSAVLKTLSTFTVTNYKKMHRSLKTCLLCKREAGASNSER
jgi:hypothetical protein